VLKIYGVPISVHTRKVIVVALAKGIQHEVIPVVPVIPDDLPANWRQLSPTGKIPVMADGDFTLADSAAICAYLERLRPATPVYPSAARDYGMTLSLEQYAGALFRDVVHPLFQETFVFPKLNEVPTNERRVAQVLNETLPAMFGYLDGAIRGDYLCGNSATIADFSVASNLITYQYIGFDLYRPRFRKLAALFDRVIGHPAMAEALRREQPVVDSMGLNRDWHVQDR
jgi:glutathione S-transferase